MVPIAIRKLILAHRKEGMTISAISKAVRVSESAIYRLFQKARRAEKIEPTYQNSSRKPEVDDQKLREMDDLVTKSPDITLAEIKQIMHLSIQKSEIITILRLKLGFRYKKDGTMALVTTPVGPVVPCAPANNLLDLLWYDCC
ncbi:MAG: helix-turn-helix domain-containing protein [Ethanoligenens sp.]